jgi:hypothetical protein
MVPPHVRRHRTVDVAHLLVFADAGNLRSLAGDREKTCVL